MTTIHYQLTRKEAMRSIMRRRMFSPLRLWIQGLFILAGLALFTLPGPAPDVGFFLIVLMIAMNVLSYLALSKVVDKAPWVTAPATLTYSDSRIAIEAGDIRQEYGWSAFGRWERTREHFLLFPGRLEAAIHVPMRAFTPAQLDEFTTLLRKIGTGPAA